MNDRNDLLISRVLLFGKFAYPAVTFNIDTHAVNPSFRCVETISNSINQNLSVQRHMIANAEEQANVWLSVDVPGAETVKFADLQKSRHFWRQIAEVSNTGESKWPRICV